MIDNGTLNGYERLCNFYATDIELFFIVFFVIIGISSAFIYFHWYLKQDNAIVANIISNTETVIY